MTNKRTLVVGASENPLRYSNIAVQSLVHHQIDVVAFAKRKGTIQGVNIETEFPNDHIHTISLYVNRKIQEEYYLAILRLHPKRVIFNPGTENSEFYSILEDNGIEAIEACTLLMLSTGQY